MRGEEGEGRNGERRKRVSVAGEWVYLRSSQSGPSRVPHWKPCTILSLTVPSSDLSTSVGRVSSTRMFGPVVSGPKAQILRAANKSQSYLV